MIRIDLLKSKTTSTFILLGIFFSAFFFSSCHNLKIAASKKPLIETKPELLIAAMDSARFQAEWVNMKVSATSELDGKSNSFTASIRIRKDSVIWISISSLSIEVARILITHDSLKLIDRINSKYLLSSFSYLNNTFQLEVDFQMLESLIFGNYFSYLNDTKLRSSYVDEDEYIISTLRRRKLKRSMEDKELHKRIIQDVWINPNTSRITKMAIDDNKLDKKVITKYENFTSISAEEEVKTQDFPHKLSMEIESAKPAKFGYEVSKITLNKEQDFPFSIPEKYTRMQ